MPLRVDQRHKDADDHRTVNGEAAIPNTQHGAPVQRTVRFAVEVQIKEHIINAGADDAAGHGPEHHVHDVVLRQSVVLGLLHTEIQPRQHGKCQNDPVPVDPVADMDGHRVNVQFPIPEQAGEADGHVFHCGQCIHNRFFLSPTEPPPHCICFRAREPTGLFLRSPAYCLGTMRLRTMCSAVTFVFRNAAMSSAVMESNTSGKRSGS